MTVLKAIILGLVQGLTEFLPVSSSGHLVLGQHLFGFKEPEILFDVILHTGTLVAVVLVFYKELGSLILEFFRLPKTLAQDGGFSAAWKERPVFRLMLLIIVGLIPTGLMGVLLKDVFESLFASTLAVGIALLITGAVLFLTSRAPATGHNISGFKTRDALAIGIAQGLAITPGISRSGMTISTGLFLGLDRELAAKYSFLLSIPAILGALILEVKDGLSGAFGPMELAVGFIAALISGYLALVLLLRLVRKGRLHYFAYYCWCVGLVTLAWSLWGQA
jgi:undecaprenyl-diphosphatase